LNNRARFESNTEVTIRFYSNIRTALTITKLTNKICTYAHKLANNTKPKHGLGAC